MVSSSASYPMLPMITSISLISLVLLGVLATERWDDTVEFKVTFFEREADLLTFTFDVFLDCLDLVIPLEVASFLRRLTSERTTFS